MILNCGETHEAYTKRVGRWHRWFFLLPRTIGEANGQTRCAWLCWGERRGKQVRVPCLKAGGALLTTMRWEYRA